MNKKVMSLLFSLILVVTTVFVSNIVAYAAEPSGGIKVTATSNYFPKKSTFIANDAEYVTVTYFIDSNKDMLNTQWELDYDPACLEFENAVNMNEAGDDLNLMPSVDNLVWKVITNEETGEQTGRIQANANKLKLYKFSGKGYIPFVTATFKVIGSGETTVDLFVDILTLSKLNSDFVSDPAEEEVIVDFGVINGTPTVPKRETAVHSGLYDPRCDITAPVISGIENGKTYCDTVQFEVSDNVGVASVTAGNEVLTAGTDGKYTLEIGKGNVTVVATDNAGNPAQVTVTVNNGHTANNDDGNCTTPVYCIYHQDTVVIAAKSHDFSGEWNKDATNHWHICQNEGCTAPDTKTPHSGGSATCTARAECEYCGEEYGKLDSSNHSLDKIPAKDATVIETGNKEYWQCTDCDKYFSDADGTNEIKHADTIIPKLPVIIKGEGQSITAGEMKELSFTSNADFSDFDHVELDGKTLDEKNYTAKEGSTIITLDADYVATLPVGEHTIGIVSESGTATTTFTVEEKAASETSDDSDKDSKSDKDSVKTGDNANLALWIALMLLSGAGITGVTAYTRRKRTNE